ncbi:uncharacterized protein TRIADDRAFT_58555 [Trichoplax adhaerens]|uniref:Aminotransferase class I/classII large domain-containing protein n=1 Tax=Trichoplax adhaerens TaxID=10228 RepID=B3S310_TRIAD|nr:hypothetical protein TRIADDRAFT_58555 [Trichoplax adhaerens]EDV22885.1 hypothetical protein TRIADDRAFT_58555 [Trichoplax adhaerens]|eukprot:XP_002114751.1 hypothetical protein TRIADDRAFT_58555 [Trichoplax adhaerens]
MRELADKYNAVIVNDDCHGAGVIGATGRGTDEYYGVKNYSDIITGSCGKAGSGCNGGYVCGPANFTTYLRHTSRQWFMSTFNSVADCAAIKESFKIMSDEPEHVKTLQENIIYFKKNLLSQGFDLPGIMEAGVVPIIIGSERTVYEVYDRLLERGIIGVGVRFPAVPKGHGRMRFTVNRAISKSQMDYVVNAMVEIRKELGGLPEITGDAIELTRGDQSKKLVSKVITLSKSDY